MSSTGLVLGQSVGLIPLHSRAGMARAQSCHVELGKIGRGEQSQRHCSPTARFLEPWGALQAR